MVLDLDTQMYGCDEKLRLNLLAITLSSCNLPQKTGKGRPESGEPVVVVNEEKIFLVKWLDAPSIL